MSTLSITHISRVAHEANRAIQLATGDPAPSPPWDDAPDWQRSSAIAGVLEAQNGASPELLHGYWVAQKISQGWSYGPVKDPEAKTHPCMVAYDDLPEAQKVKDYVFQAVVRELSSVVLP